MRTQLEYLGHHESITKVEDERTWRKVDHAFGWIDVVWSTGEKVPCMVAWIPGNKQTEFGLWPVYTADQPRPNLDGKTSWKWDGKLEQPKLTPSILQYVMHKDQRYETAHGFVRQGGWEY